MQLSIPISYFFCLVCLRVTLNGVRDGLRQPCRNTMLTLRYPHWSLTLIRATFDFWHGCRNLFCLHMIIVRLFLVQRRSVFFAGRDRLRQPCRVHNIVQLLKHQARLQLSIHISYFFCLVTSCVFASNIKWGEGRIAATVQEDDAESALPGLHQFFDSCNF